MSTEEQIKRGTGEAVLGAVVFIGGLVLEKFFKVDHATVVGFIGGTALFTHGMHRGSEEIPQE